MPIVLDKTDLTVEELVQVVRQLEPEERNILIDQIIGLRSEPEQADDAELVSRAKQPLLDVIKKRYRLLRRRRQAETITPEQYEELLALTNDIEIRNAERIRCIAILAKRRNKPLRAMMDELGIVSGTYA